MPDTNEILEKSDFEALRLYEPTSATHREIDAKVREVFVKLFRNTDININDFYFTGFDNRDSNAFFIEKSKTKNGKHIIAVSSGLIQNLSSTQELAAIIGHESGHYLWSELLGGRNTIFQERAADLRSVDLMINAGYNPRYILSAQEKVFGRLNYRSVDLDVHGNSINRIEDVKSYLTKLAAERGDFSPPTDQDPEYEDFKKHFQKTLEKEPYQTYIQKALFARFKTSDTNKIKRPDLLRFFIDETENIIENNTRLSEFYNMFDYLNFEHNQTPEETKLLQQLILKQISAHKATKRSCGFTRLIRDAHIKAFGPYLDFHQDVKNFIKNAYNYNNALFYARKINENRWMAEDFRQFTDYKDYIIKFEPQELVGKTAFWEKLLSYRDYEIERAYKNVVYDYERYDEKLVVANKSNYFLDENGVIIAYGDEAYKMHEQQKLKSDREKAERLFSIEEKRIKNELQLYDVFSDFMHGKISAKDVVNHPQYQDITMNCKTHVGRITDYDLTSNSHLIDNQRWMDLYNSILSSKYYADYSKYFKEPIEPLYRKNVNPDIRNTINSILGQQPIEIYKKIFDAYLDLAQYQKQIGNIEEESRLYDLQFGVSSDKNEYLEKKLPKYLSQNLKQVYTLYNLLKDAIAQDFTTNNTELIENVIHTLGFKRLPKNEQELIFFTERLLEINVPMRTAKYNDELFDTLCECDILEKYYMFRKYSDWGFDISSIVFVNYLNSGYKCNPVHIIKLFENIDRRSKYDNYKEIIAKHITHKQFDSLSLPDKVYLYEFLDNIHGFSESAANKNYFIKKIVQDIISSQNVEYAKKFLTRESFTPFSEEKYSTQDFEFANEREQLIEFYANHWAKKIGRDDGSILIEQRAQNLVDFIKTTVDVKTLAGKEEKQPLFSRMIAKELTDRIANKIYAQEKVTRILDSVNHKSVSGQDAEKYDYFGRAAESVFNALARDSDRALATIEFLNSELNDESIEKLLKKFEKTEQNTINKQSLTIIHENFWAANLPIRAYVMNRLLNAYSTVDEHKLNLVLDMYFKPGSKYYSDAKLVLGAVYNNLQDYERSLILSALIAAGKTSKSDNLSSGATVGRGLKMFLQNKGPAFIKFGQLLSYLPSLDPDMRAELSNLRDKANIPTRAELFDLLKQSLPESEYARISHIGKILGAGSFFITVQIKYNGKDCVVSLMRPNTQKLTADGINMISNTINELVAADKKFAPLRSIVAQARDSAFSEIDIEQDHRKYTDAVKIYESITVHTSMGDYSPCVARWITYGSAPDKNNAYKIMEMAPGASLTSNEFSEEEKHDMALAYTTLELAILLSGNKWDTDRHAGQQNFTNRSFREFCIGIFDTGAQMNSAPGTLDKIMLGHLLYHLIVGVKKGENISDILTKKIQDFDRIGKKFGIDTMYMDGIQRGITALSDIIQYQKEIRDEDGNIIQEAKSLTKSDLEYIAKALMSSGIIDKTLLNATRSRAMLKMLSLLFSRKGQLFQKSDENSENPISITVNKNFNILLQTRKLDKAISEIRKLLYEKRANEHLGVQKGLTVKKEDIETFESVAIRA